MKNIYLLIVLAIFIVENHSMAQTIEIVGPPGSGAFGSSIHTLPNGNYLVADPYFDEGSLQDVGAVYMYNGKTNTVISMLKGSKANDQIGDGGFDTVGNSNVVVKSLSWNGFRGALTWINGETGLSGVVSSVNSLVGTSPAYLYGNFVILKFANGNYLVKYSNVNGGRGSVTMANGETAISGEISIANSLLGSKEKERLGECYLFVNGKYVIVTPSWNNDAGALTGFDGETAVKGVVSSANSLVGPTAQSNLDWTFLYLNSGNVLLVAPHWHDGRGAVTLITKDTDLKGVVNAQNSLIGREGSFDEVGRDLDVLPNGNYVVRSCMWNESRGAVTLGSGVTPTVGVVSSANSITGANPGEYIGQAPIDTLANGNYVTAASGENMPSSYVTWGNGNTDVTGILSSTNSLVGSIPEERIGTRITGLANGNYVVVNESWNDYRGAILLCDGAAGKTGGI